MRENSSHSSHDYLSRGFGGKGLSGAENAVRFGVGQAGANSTKTRLQMDM